MRRRLTALLFALFLALPLPALASDYSCWWLSFWLIPYAQLNVQTDREQILYSYQNAEWLLSQPDPDYGQVLWWLGRARDYERALDQDFTSLIEYNSAYAAQGCQ